MPGSATLVKAAPPRGAMQWPLRIALGALAALAGLACLAFAGLIFLSAHAAHPVERDGAVVAYHEITLNGAYARNELQLADDPHIYTFDSRQFHPTLPQRFVKDTRVQLWVDQGTSQVLALTLYDQLGLNPVTYSTGEYDNPAAAFYTTEGEAGGLAALAVGLLVVGAVMGLRRKPRQAIAPPAERAAPPAVASPAWLSAPDPVPSHPQGVPALAPHAAVPASGAGAPAAPLVFAAQGEVDQLPTQKMPAAASAANTAGGTAQPPTPPRTPTPPPGQAGTPSTAAMPPGSLPDFPTERMPAAPTSDVADEPTRKSESVMPPDQGHAAS